MSTRIKRVNIDNLLGKGDVCWDLNDDVNVLVGKNGAGKSSILNIIKSLLAQSNDNSINIDICKKAEITLNNSNIIGCKPLPKTTEETLKKAFSLISEKFEQKKKTSTKKKINITQEMIHQLQLEVLNELFSEVPSNTNWKPEEHNSKDEGYVLERIDGEVDNQIPFEYISTINMNANSLNEIHSSDGRKTTILDMEIENEISRLNAFGEFCEDESNLRDIEKSKSIKARLISTINSMLDESDKEMDFDGDELIFTSTIDNKKLKLSQLSSGERQLVYTLIKTAIAAHSNAILLMDEPEISLHLSWQEMLISKIRKINTNGQIIIVTHSPAIVMDGWMDSFVDIDDIMKNKVFHEA